MKSYDHGFPLPRGPKSEHIGIFEAAQALLGCLATDPKDKVYSSLGLINHREARLISTDYTLTPSTIFAKATFASAKARGDLKIFLLITVRGDKSEDLPKWAVNFGNLQTDDVRDPFSYAGHGTLRAIRKSR